MDCFPVLTGSILDCTGFNQHQEVITEIFVAYQFDIAADLGNGMFIELGEIPGYAKYTGSPPFNGIGDFLTIAFKDQQFEICLVVEQPVEVIEALIDDVLIGVAFVLQDDGTIVFIQS